MDRRHPSPFLVVVLMVIANAGVLACTPPLPPLRTSNTTSTAALAVPDFTLLTYNIKTAYAPSTGAWDPMGDPSMVDFAAVIAAEDPDVVALQEVQALGTGGEYDGTVYDDIYYEDQVRSLSELTGLPYYAHTQVSDRAHSSYVDIWDATAGLSARGGVAILSKHPFVGAAQLVEHARDPNNAVNHVAVDSNRAASLLVTVELPLTGGGTMLTDVVCAHLSSDSVRRKEQAHDIERRVTPGRPAFLLGDMNARQADLDDLPEWTDPRSGQPEVLAYPSWGPWKQIDWILYRNIELLLTVDAYAVSAPHSDHQPWVVRPQVLAECAPFDAATPDPALCAHATCGPCLAGTGDCDNDGECAPGLVCAIDVGAAYGLPATYDVCEVPPSTIAVPAKIQETFANSGPASLYPTTYTYAIDVATADTFSVKLRTATNVSDRMATLYVDGRPQGRRLVLANTGSWSTFAETAFKHIPLAAGDHVLRVELDGDGVNVDWVDVFAANNGPFGQLPWPMPAQIQAEDYNVGGSYSASAGNAGGLYRFEDDVDIFSKESHGQLEGGYRVVLAPGDWLEYNVDAKEADTFDLTLRYATLFSGARATVAVNGVTTMLGWVLPQTATSGPTVPYATVTTQDMAFGAGISTVRITSTGTDGFSLDELAFHKVWRGPLPGTPWPIPGVIEAENYDLRASAWSDTTAGNAGEVLRWDGVDLWFGSNNIGNDHFVWSTAAGEYLEYTVDVDVTDDYDIDVRYATTRSNKTVSLLCDGAPLAGPIALAPTCGWGTDGNCWAIASATRVPMSAGEHVLRLVMDTGLHNVDYLTIEPSP